MQTTVGTIGTVYYCPISKEYFKIVGEHESIKVEPTDEDIQDPVRISNWRDFHLRGQTNPAGASNSGQNGSGHRDVAKYSVNEGPVSGNVQSWIDEAAAILEQHGIHMSEQDKRNMAIIAMHESSGNPRAVNNHDGNAAAGHPSKGLVQTIQPTFDAYNLPGYDDIMNPVDNIIAGYRYAIDTYGSTDNVPGIKSLNNGSEYVGY